MATAAAAAWSNFVHTFFARLASVPPQPFLGASVPYAIEAEASTITMMSRFVSCWYCLR